MGNPGAVANNFYQGTRSEYLAQYVFSMFGTAVQVPHEADVGFDLSCTLTRTNGGRGEPYAYYSVQVKSTPGPWVFGVPGSVRWILGYPAPLLFCIVDKAAAQFTVYQLLARFQAAAMTDPPESLTLIPGEPGSTAPVQGDPGTNARRRPHIGWDADGNVELGPPILQFSIAELLEDDAGEVIREVLDYWVRLDLRNLLRQQMGMRTASGPAFYETGKLPPQSGFASFGMSIVPDDVRERASKTAAEHLDWLGHVMEQRGDQPGALLAALLVRHLLRGESLDRQLGFSPASLYVRLGHAARKAFPDIAGGSTVVAPFDNILAHLHQLTAQGDQGAPPC
jgi:hypothetical protein